MPPIGQTQRTHSHGCAKANPRHATEVSKGIRKSPATLGESDWHRNKYRKEDSPSLSAYSSYTRCLPLLFRLLAGQDRPRSWGTDIAPMISTDNASWKVPITLERLSKQSAKVPEKSSSDQVR